MAMRPMKPLQSNEPIARLSSQDDGRAHDHRWRVSASLTAIATLALGLNGCGLIQVRGQINGKPFGTGAPPPAVAQTTPTRPRAARTAAAPAATDFRASAPSADDLAAQQERQQQEAARQQDADVAVIVGGVLAAAALVALSQSAQGQGSGNYQPSAPTQAPGTYDDEESPMEKAERHSRCIDACGYQTPACGYDEDPSSCSSRQWNAVQSCRNGCGP
jgi:hypothetical protein